MARSIRWRLQLWYATVLVVVVAGFAGLLFYRVRAGMLREVDAELEAAAVYLDANLRRFPPHDLETASGDPHSPDSFAREGPDRRGPLPPPPPREHLLAGLTPPKATDSGSPSDQPRATYFAIWRADGSILKASGLPAEITLAALTARPPSPQPQVTAHGLFREVVMLGPWRTSILVGQSTAKTRADLEAFAWQLAAVGVLVLAVGVAGGWLISARILRPVAAISTTAAAISATNLAERINPETVDRELAELARVLNATFERLETAFERQARFTADASHELRTPLAILRTHTELALSRPRSAEEYRETLATCLRAANRMTALVEGLLTLARADAGKLDLECQPVDLGQVAGESLDLVRPLAQDKGVSLTAHLERVVVSGDSIRLAQVVTNLLTNAVQYNRAGGEVRLHLSVSAGEAILSVTDTGCGIPEPDRLHLFERFYRVDKARARTSGGTGLGLAICHSVVIAHGGTIGFETEVNRGSTFWVRLPCHGGGSG